jgi:hypothetical protein
MASTRASSRGNPPRGNPTQAAVSSRSMRAAPLVLAAMLLAPAAHASSIAMEVYRRAMNEAAREVLGCLSDPKPGRYELAVVIREGGRGTLLGFRREGEDVPSPDGCAAAKIAQKTFPEPPVPIDGMLPTPWGKKRELKGVITISYPFFYGEPPKEDVAVEEPRVVPPEPQGVPPEPWPSKPGTYDNPVTLRPMRGCGCVLAPAEGSAAPLLALAALIHLRARARSGRARATASSPRPRATRAAPAAAPPRRCAGDRRRRAHPRSRCAPR